MKDKNKKTKIEKKFIVIWTIIVILLVSFLFYVGFTFWNKYKTDIINKQKEQMQIIATALSKSMKETIDNYARDLNQICNVVDYNQNESNINNEIFRQYLDSKGEYIDDLKMIDSGGNVIWSGNDITLEETFGICQMDNKTEFIEGKCSDDKIHFIIRKRLENGDAISITIDVEQYYANIISDIRLGTNGYIVVKNSEGIIFMHPLVEQLGKTVIKGREELYQNVNLDSLEKLIEYQNEHKSGVFEYYSYWWEDTKLPKTKKISAFDRFDCGSDYFIVSAVMDYDDIYKPIISSFKTIAFTFLGIFFIMVTFIGFLSYLTIQRKKNMEEIEYLRDLNEILEETKRSEEVIAHQQRLQIMGTMTGGIVHEFNNLLTPIMGYAEMLLGEFSEGSDEYDYAYEILEASEKAKDVIRQISGLSRKNMETVFHYIAAKKMINRSVKMVNSICPSNIQLEIENNINQEGFLGNDTQMNQVILNLCVNAFHAIGTEKKGTVCIKTSIKTSFEIEKKHNINISSEFNKFICICVSDNGIGMQPDVLNQIFNPFFTTKSNGQGTGLGLSVVDQIIHSHKGHIDVESTYGVGTSFYVYLPIIEKDVTSDEDTETHTELQNIHIMAIDDNEKILKLLERRFKKLGITITTLSDTKEAKEKLSKEKYNILLIDEELSKDEQNRTGIYFAMSINGLYPNIIKIIMTSQVKKDIIEAKQQGIIDDYIEKPVSDTQIIETIRICSKI